MSYSRVEYPESKSPNKSWSILWCIVQSQSLFQAHLAFGSCFSPSTYLKTVQT